MQAEDYLSWQQRRALDVILTDGRTAALNVVCRGDWSLASWSDGGQTSLLATTAGEEELRRLMGEA